MENFIAYNPTALHFGKDVVNQLGTTITQFGKKVLLVYGKGSVKRSGLYDRVMAQLQSAGAEVIEYSGIKSNPLVKDVDAAAELGRKHQVDAILAVGGGSTIDSAKIISIAIPVNHPAWDFYEGKAKPQTSIPLVAVLTLAATGSEMNPFAVLQNPETGRKDGYGHPLLYPKHSFLDPQNTISVPKNYTAYGIADLIAHSFENYFGAGETTLPDRFVFGILAEAMEYGPQLLNNLTDYTLREKIMYAATMALNGLTQHGKKSGDWGVHSIGHVLSLLYDIPHGASLSIAYPAWFKLHKEKAAVQIAKLGKNLFGTEDVDKTIAGFEDFFKKIECPVCLSEVNIGKQEHDKIFDYLVLNKAGGANYQLSEEDYRKIIRLMA
ncbi:MAG: iron-containing alcohol dehydrogenase [Lentimicrobiaceae bacterium]|jgi:hypothetical protein|nr:iron-containing alcohol dehydrogenase [Lentimicrobiaceae bacterium]